MNEHEVRGDRGMDTLSILTTHAPDQDRAALGRSHCHAALRKRDRRQRVGRVPPRVSWRRAVEPAIVGALCAVYLFEVLSRALQLYRF